MAYLLLLPRRRNKKGQDKRNPQVGLKKKRLKQRIWEMKRRIMKSLAVGLMRVEEQLDDLSLQVQDCLHTMEE